MKQISETFKNWLDESSQLVTRDQLITIGIMALLGVLLLSVVWGILFCFAIDIEFKATNPLYIFSLMVSGVKGPYTASLVFALTPFIIGGLYFWHEHVQMGVHGRARWGNKADLQRANMLEPETTIKGVKTPSVIMGKRGSNYVYAAGTEAVFVYAPTGGGKGIGIMIPNLLNWDHSVVVLDAKTENFMTTSGFRKQHGQDVYLWNPGAPYGTEDTGNTKTHRFNPLDLIPRDQLLRVDAIQKIWDIFFPKSMDKGQIWGPSARSLALGLSVYLMDHGERFTFGEIRRIVNITSNFELFLETLLKRHFDEGENFSLDLVCVINFNEFLQKAEKERSGVVSTLNSALEIWANPFVDAATSASDFDIRDLRRKRMSIYLGITPGNIKRFAPLMNMFFQQVISVMTEHEPKTDEPYTALLAIDEFPLLGKMDILKDGVAFLRSYRVKPMFVCQSKSQISEIYGDHGSQSMFQNCKTKNAFVPNDIKEAKEISEQLGKKTVVTYSRTYTNAGIGQGSLSKSYTSRELMKPDEVMRFTKHKSILLVENTRPIKVKKVQWFKDKNFKSRVIEPSPIPLINVDKFRAEIEKDINPELKLAFEESQKNKDGKPASLKDLSPDDAKALSEFI